VIPVFVPARRGPFRTETAGMIASLGGAMVLLQGFFLAEDSTGFLLWVFFGVAIIALAALASVLPRNRDAVGLGIVGLAAASLVAGGGFYVGWILAIAGGVLLASVRWTTRAPRPTSKFSSEALGPLCPNCGRHVPTWTSKCPYCGVPENGS
jgi:hypothetical protein